MSKKPIQVDFQKAALTRISELALRGRSPEYLAQEVDRIVARLRQSAASAPEDVRERLAEMCDDLFAGVQSARAQVEAMDASDTAAICQGAQSLAALIAARDAMANAYGAFPR
ncbi:MAG: hypothetical protein JWP20_2671 [Roseomonas sp.]|jgi:hypothetical protein|nr:hypothetical protein [Roseomonas sp.]